MVTGTMLFKDQLDQSKATCSLKIGHCGSAVQLYSRTIVCVQHMVNKDGVYTAKFFKKAKNKHA